MSTAYKGGNCRQYRSAIESVWPPEWIPNKCKIQIRDNALAFVNILSKEVPETWLVLISTMSRARPGWGTSRIGSKKKGSCQKEIRLNEYPKRDQSNGFWKNKSVKKESGWTNTQKGTSQMDSQKRKWDWINSQKDEWVLKKGPVGWFYSAHYFFGHRIQIIQNTQLEKIKLFVHSWMIYVRT